jgi:integrase
MKLRAELDYIQAFKNRRYGKVYYYYRRAGKRIPIKSKFGTAAFLREVADIEKKFNKTSENTPGTLGFLIESYKASQNFIELKTATRISYERAFCALKPFSSADIKDFKRSTIIELRDRVLLPKYKIWMANYAITVLSVLFRFGHDVGLVHQNPLRERVRKLRNRERLPANRPWAANERQIILESAAPHIRLPLALAMCTGLRKADVFTITMAAVSDGVISVRTSKRGVPIKLPLHPLLVDALAGRPNVDAVQIALRADGKPWTPDGFDTAWHKLKTKLESEGKVEKGLTIHGLRHTLGTLLKEAGAHDGEIADVLGQTTTAMARHYSKEAGISDKMSDVVKRLQIVTKDKKTR